MQLQKRFIVGPCQGFPLSWYRDVINRTKQWSMEAKSVCQLHITYIPGPFDVSWFSISDTCQMQSKIWKIRDQTLSCDAIFFFHRQEKPENIYQVLKYFMLEILYKGGGGHFLEHFFANILNFTFHFFSSFFFFFFFCKRSFYSQVSCKFQICFMRVWKISTGTTLTHTLTPSFFI